MATVLHDRSNGKQGLREWPNRTLAKAHYLAGRLKPRFTGPFSTNS